MTLGHWVWAVCPWALVLSFITLRLLPRHTGGKAFSVRRGSYFAAAHLLWVVAFLDQQWGQKMSESQLISKYYLFLWPQWTKSGNNELEALPLTRWALELTERAKAGFARQCQVTVRQFCESSEPASSVGTRNRKHVCFSMKDRNLLPTVFETVTQVMPDLKMTEASRATTLGTNHSLGLRCD